MSTTTTAAKNGQVRIREYSISRLKPSPENDRLYRPVNPADPEIKALQVILRESIDAVIDTEAFNKELDAEESDAAYLQGVRNTVHKSLAELDFDQEIS